MGNIPLPRSNGESDMYACTGMVSRLALEDAAEVNL